MRATVIIVTFDHASIVPRCLDALRATVGPDDEVLVVDNASADDTAGRVEVAYPWVRLERLPTNVGFGAACNRGASLAHGNALVFLNPDTEPQPGWLDALLATLEPAPEGTLATAKLLLAGTPGRVDTFGNEIHISGITTCRGWGQPAEVFARPDEVSAVSGACFAISRRLFWRLDGFDGRLFLYFEDTDLSLRARLAGARCVAVPDALVLHDHRPGFSPAKLRYLERNRWWTLLKVCRWRTLVALAPVLLMSEAVAWGMALGSGWRHVAAKLLAYADLARWLGDLPAARATLQETRVIADAQLLALHSTQLRFGQAVSGPLGRRAEALVARAFGGGRALAAAMGA
ncbi:MAG: glycosyltransferase family 2 protein [Chloroflexota bacterium]